MASLVDISGLFTSVTGLLERFLPDPQQKAAAQLQLAQIQSNLALAQLTAQSGSDTAQAQIDNTEASSASIFVSGWRPALGWICVFAFGANYFLLPLLSWASSIWQLPPPPKLELGDLMTLLLGMLGLGAMRSAEKISGVGKS